IFTHTLDEGWYRYHEVLRRQLEATLVATVGEAEARQRYRRAGELLERAGALPAALQAYCRAEDWAAGARLLERDGEQLIEGPAGWIDLVPPSILNYDPWLMLATARRHRAAGRWEDAVQAYQRAEKAFG